MTARKFRPCPGSACISAPGVVPPSLVREQRGDPLFKKKKMGEVTERATQRQQPETAGTRTAETGKEAVERALGLGALQRRNFCKSCLPARYQPRAGLWFSRSRNPALTAGLFFDKQDASI